RQRRLCRGCVALGPHSLRPRELAPLDLGVESVELDLLRPSLPEPIHPHDDPLAALDLRAVAVRRLLDLPLDEALLDRRDRPAELLDAVDEVERPRLQLVGQRL